MNPNADTKDIEADAAAWFERHEWSEWDATAEREFQAWLSASTAHRIAFIRLQAAWERAERLKALGAGIPVGQVPARGAFAFASVPSAIEPSQPDAAPSDAQSTRSGTRRSRRPSGWRLAAAGSLAALAILAWYASTPHWQTFVTRVGTVAPVMLPDGSRLTLDSNTRLRVAFDSHHRTVRLDRGEAVFVVAKNPARPFTVEIADKRVVAVGTLFSVRRNADDIQVLVEEGRVRVEDHAGLAGTPRTTQLEAGGEAETHRGEIVIAHPGLPEIERQLSWRDGYLAFQGTQLSVVVAEFNRYLAKPIEIDDPSIESIRIGGRFRCTDPEAFLALLQQGFPVAVNREVNRVSLRRR